MHSVYWIRNASHTDIFSQGYVGVSSNVAKRWEYHRKHGENTHLRHAINKYGWEGLIKEVIVIADADYCLDVEAKLRPANQMGWNIVAGGGNPPSYLGKKDSKEVRAKKAISKLGNKHGNGHVVSAEVRAKIGAANKGHKYLVGRQNGLKYTYIGTNIVTGEKLQVTGTAEIKKAGFHAGHINECAIGKQKTHKGYKWIKEFIK